MKKIWNSLGMTLTFVVAFAYNCNVQAQISDGHWYNGTNVYSASQQADGKIVMHAMDEGEELGFILVPISGKADKYKVANTPQEFVNVYGTYTTVHHLTQDGYDVLCFYNANNQLVSVMSNETEWDAEKLNKQRWLSQLYGEYASEEENEVEKVLLWTEASLSIGSIIFPYKVVTFNGRIVHIIQIQEVPGSTNELQGTWEVVPTLKGFDLISLNTETGSTPWEGEADGTRYVFAKTDPDSGRFSYASHLLLNDQQFSKLDSKALRIMRNEILAHHGYQFQSEDLKKYFGSQSWYKPAKSNKEVKLSFIEELNLQLIQHEEAKRSGEEYE